ncbi:hypothetical protein PEBR_35496 [Penicillium brasilianum]|uniref:Uncharacterized protein n=1 Tax=Penicillium brasilianum TaxID=104259 RepID=A0A1S9RDG0_PENBI|nr:hypothetical protein PEBR_35496 [Penicillium brasilianum]
MCPSESPNKTPSSSPGDIHRTGPNTLCFLNGPPSIIKANQPFSVTIGLPSTQQSTLPNLRQNGCEAIHLSLRLAENNSAANLLSGNLTSTITCGNGPSPSSVTFDGIRVVKAGRLRLRALLGIDSDFGVRVAFTVDSNIFEVLT